MHRDVHCSMIHSGRDMETTTRPSIDDRVGTLRCVYTVERHSAVRKDGTLPFVTAWVDPEMITLSEVRQKELRTV